MAGKEPKARRMNTAVRFLSSDELLGRSPLAGSQMNEDEGDELDRLMARDLKEKARNTG